MTETLLEKIQKLRDEWMQFKSNVATLMSSTQTAIDNANETMDEIQSTLATIQKTMEDYGPPKYDVKVGGEKNPKKYTCVNCGKKSNHSYSSGYCDDCYMKKFHSNVEVEERIKKHRWWW